MSIATARNEAMKMHERLREIVDTPESNVYVVVANQDIEAALDQLGQIYENDNPEDPSQIFIIDISDGEDFQTRKAELDKKFGLTPEKSASGCTQVGAADQENPYLNPDLHPDAGFQNDL